MYSTTKLGHLACGTCLQETVKLVPSDIVYLFGEPMESDGYKVSGEFVFTGVNGAIVTLYDWKSTSLYDNSCESPSEFWSSLHPRLLHVGGNGRIEANEFIDWLKSKLK
jgi:hypothetical protein